MAVERKISEATQAANPIDTDAELPTNYNGLARKITVEQILLVGDTRFGAAGARTPTAHAASHAAAGSDAVTLAQSQVTDLVTDLSAKALKTITITAGTGLTGGGDLSANRTLAVSYGSTAGTACQGNDARLGLTDYWARWWA